jgi:hypothetical protein
MLTLCHHLSRHCPSYTNPLFSDDIWTEWEARAERHASRLLKQNQLQPQLTLYHGTCNPHLSLDSLSPERPTFFGLEPVISMWYTLEEAEKQSLDGDYGYVYEFITTQPITISRYIPSIREHPGCETCVHPQIALHGYHNYNALKGPFDLSIEVTLQQGERDGLVQIGRYAVELKHLRELTGCSINQLRLIKTDDEMRFEKVI